MGSVWIDNHIFRLHYKGTVTLFIVASILTAWQFIGHPIDCLVNDIDVNYMNTYCWSHATLTILSRQVGEQGVDFAHQGIVYESDLKPGTELKYHGFYQWMCLVLLFQAILFYIPRLLWKISEGGKIKKLVQGLMESRITEEDRDAQISWIVKYFCHCRGTHSLYAAWFFGCELLNFVNVVGQIFLLDMFLDNQFLTYGIDVIKYYVEGPSDRQDPTLDMFPKVTHCVFYNYGPSGLINAWTGLCLLPMNAVNKKIFLVIWFWFALLATVTGIFLIYRLAVLQISHLRVSLIACQAGKETKRSRVEAFLEPTSFTYWQKMGDWLVMNLICKNLDVPTISDLFNLLDIREDGNSSVMVPWELELGDS